MARAAARGDLARAGRRELGIEQPRLDDSNTRLGQASAAGSISLKRRVPRLVLGVVNASEVLDGLAALPGARDSGADGNGITASRLLNGIEYARASAIEEAKLRASWKRRQGGGATPLVLVADDPEQQGYVRVLGPQRDGPMRRVRSESLRRSGRADARRSSGCKRCGCWPRSSIASTPSASPD